MPASAKLQAAVGFKAPSLWHCQNFYSTGKCAGLMDGTCDMPHMSRAAFTIAKEKAAQQVLSGFNRSRSNGTLV